MHYRTLGTDGPDVSVVGLGCNNFGMKIDAAQTAEVVAAALDAGITHFDTAEMYGDGKSEEFLGAALAGRRDAAFIATKFLPRPEGDEFAPGRLRSRMIESVESSLRRLQTDRIDLFYQHYPDADAPLEELTATFAELVEAGKVLNVALSNPFPELIAAATKTAPDLPWRAVQVEWNLLARAAEEDVIPAATERGLGVIPYFPLASGLLTGKYSSGEFPEGSRLATIPWFAEVATPENLARVRRLDAIAADHGRSLIELAFGWLLHHDDVSSLIAGATTPEQVATNAAAASWTLDDDVLRQIEDALRDV